MKNEPDNRTRFTRRHGRQWRSWSSLLLLGAIVCGWLDSVRKQSKAEVARTASHDGLTGLPNRRLLLERMTQALAKSERDRTFGAVLFLHLDGFKGLNDTLGHDAGDYLLKQVAMRLCDATRESDTVARLGGDEFVVLLENLGNVVGNVGVHAGHVADKIVRMLGAAHRINGEDIVCTSSVGIALFDPDTRTIDHLLKQGDMAMHQAKAAGRNGYRFFDHDGQAEKGAGSSLETQLHDALAARQFALFYQPVVDQHDAMVGVEALIRWRHSERGWVGPAEFIGQAEKSGLVVEIGNWVLEEACRQLAAWSLSRQTDHLTIAVNISARQAHQANFVAQVKNIVDMTGARPSRLKLELTESLPLESVDAMIGKMQELKAVGVGFALDDFGTGYASLSYLERMPFNQLKIDRSFVNDMLFSANAGMIVRAMICLAKNLGLEVVAEGVENESQLMQLRAFGCNRFQGFLFSPPVALTQLNDWLLVVPEEVRHQQAVP